MEFKTSIHKGRDGWQAETNVTLAGITDKNKSAHEAEGVPTLKITTSKRYNGTVSTNASVVFATETGFRCMLGFGGPDGDFSGNVRTPEKMRVTEKSLAAYHAKSLESIDAILFAVGRHYGVSVGDLIPAEPVPA